MDYDALEGKQLEKCISLMIDLINRKGAYDSAAFRKQKQIEKLGIEKIFDVIVDGNQISHSKPDPEVFLLAAEKLHQKPSDCLVVEDAEAGVKAALNGGFLVAGIGPAKDCPNVNYPLLSLSQLLAIKGWQT